MNLYSQALAYIPHIGYMKIPRDRYCSAWNYDGILHYDTNTHPEAFFMKEKNYRSLLKSISWRITGTLDTFAISYLITGKISTAISISGVEIVTKITLYYFHERIWNKIKIGKVAETPSDYQI